MKIEEGLCFQGREREALWEWSVLPKNVTQWLQPVLETRLLNLESIALTTGPPHLHKNVEFGIDCW